MNVNEVVSFGLGNAPAAKKSPPQVEVFMEAAILLGSEFLACGGPVTRLEGQLSTAGVRSGYETAVHATPSAITIYCHLGDEQESYSRGRRIPSFGIDLGRLSLIDKMLNRFAHGEIPCHQVKRKLEEMRSRIRTPHVLEHFVNVAGIGAGAALLSGADSIEALKCGLFSVFVRLVVMLGGRFFALNAMFTDFVACFTAFLTAAALKDLLGVSPQLLTIGTLVYVVPGLLMTTAISEIVDQNYLSGTIRLLKALCTFMAMALAYFLAMDLGRSLAINIQEVPIASHAEPWFFPRLIGSVMILLCSAYEFRARKKLILGILVCGLSGAICYIATQSSANLVASHFLSAFVIGLVSYLMSRRFDHPSQIYSVPSVLILAPGMLAFSSFGYGSHEDFSLPSIVRAALISLSIVFGLAASRLPFRHH